jgi:hypothetical protein
MGKDKDKDQDTPTNKKLENATQIISFILPILSLITGLLGAILGANISGRHAIEALEREYALIAEHESAQTQTIESYLTSIPTSTHTPYPTNTPEIDLNHVIIKKDLHLIGYTNWYPAKPGYENENYRWTKNTQGPEENIALWCPNIPQDGRYEIQVFIPRKDLSNDSNIRDSELVKRAIYQLVVLDENEDGQLDDLDIEKVLKSVEFDQDINSNGNWHTLEGFSYQYFKDERTPCVKLSDKTIDTPTRIILVDAMRWVYIED